MRRAVPASARALSSLTRIDYDDCFGFPTSAAATPERWARAVFGNEPSLGQRIIWRGMLGFRLSTAPGTVAGWRIGDHGPTWIRLETNSWFLSANLIVETPSRGTGEPEAGHRDVAVTTCLRYDRWPGRLWWPPLSAVHRHLMPGILRRADTRLSAPTAA